MCLASILEMFKMLVDETIYLMILWTAVPPLSSEKFFKTIKKIVKANINPNHC